MSDVLPGAERCGDLRRGAARGATRWRRWGAPIATLLLVCSHTSSPAARGSGLQNVCFESQCGVYLPAKLDGRAVPVNAQLWYMGTRCAGFEWSVEYDDGTLPEIGPTTVILNGDWNRLPYLFEIGREVVVQSKPRCRSRRSASTPASCSPDLEDDCCSIEQQPIEDVARFIVAAADETRPEAPELRVSCRDDGLVQIELLSIAVDAVAIQVMSRGLDDDPAHTWSEPPSSYSRLEGFCNEPGDEVQVPIRRLSLGAGGWEAWDGQRWLGARVIDNAGNAGAVQEVLLDSASCERVVTNDTIFAPVRCTSAAWPAAPELDVASPLASEFATPIASTIHHPLEFCSWGESGSDAAEADAAEADAAEAEPLPAMAQSPDSGVDPDSTPVTSPESQLEPGDASASALDDTNDADVANPPRLRALGAESTPDTGGCACRAHGTSGSGAWLLGLLLAAGLGARLRHRPTRETATLTGGRRT